MINEVSIRCFLTLAKTLSFTETARLTYMTQQSVSKYIAKLESDLGYPLFIRTHHYVMMTKAGENFYHLFQRFTDDFDATVEKTKKYYANMYNSLHIGYLEWLEISSSIGEALKRIKTDSPDLRFIGEKHPQYELNELFLNRKLDLIITYKEFAPKGTGLKKIKVLETPLVLLVSPDNPKAVPGATAADFRSEPFIKAAASRESLSESKNRARRQCREMGFNPSELVISPNLESAYMATEFGQGVLVSTMLSRMSLHSELLCYDLGKKEELLCFWHEDQENPAVAAFAAALEQVHQE
jgi:DNA-binding transcriptional LysR family regulator